jgi:O-antigen/teichoic acid export membrane protein
MIAKRLVGHLPVNIAQALAGFGAVAAFTRLLSPEDYGRYALVLVASQLLHTITLTWAEAGAFRFHAAAKAKADLPGHFATLNMTILGAAALGAALIIGLYFSLSFDPALAAGACLACGASVLRFATRIARETDRASHQVARYSIGETVYSLGGLGMGIAFSATTALGPGAPFLGLLLASAIMAIPDLRRLLQEAQGGRPTVQRIGAFAAYGMPLALALSLELAVQAGARFSIFAALGDAAVGAYAAAFGLARTIDLLFVWGGMAAAPLALTAFEQQDRTATLAIARGMARTLYALTIPAFVGLALVAEPLAHAMVGPALAPVTAQLVPYLAASGLFAGFSTYYFSEAFQLTRRTGLRALVMLAPAAATIALVGPLASSFGLVAAAIATAAATALGTALLAIVGARLLPLPLALPDLARAALAAAAMIPVVLALPALGGWPELLLKAAAGAATYGIAALALDVAGSRTIVLGLWQRLAAKAASRAG